METKERAVQRITSAAQLAAAYALVNSVLLSDQWDIDGEDGHFEISQRYGDNVEVEFYFYKIDKLRQIRRLIGGNWEKELFGYSVKYKSERDGLNITLRADREQVCKRIQVGTRKIPARKIEATEEPIYEWECD